MSKKFNIHDWQAKQRLNEQAFDTGMDQPLDNVTQMRLKGMDARMDQQSGDTLRDEIKKYIGLTFASWMSPSHPEFSKEYATSPYIDKLVDGIMDIVNKGNLEEMNTLASAGSGATFTAGDGEAYATPHAFKKKRKRNNN